MLGPGLLANCVHTIISLLSVVHRVGLDLVHRGPAPAPAQELIEVLGAEVRHADRPRQPGLWSSHRESETVGLDKHRIPVIQLD